MTVYTVFYLYCSILGSEYGIQVVEQICSNSSVLASSSSQHTAVAQQQVLSLMVARVRPILPAEF